MPDYAAKRALAGSDKSDVDNAIEEVLGWVPSNARWYPTKRARTAFLRSTETDLWDDTEVLMYERLSDLAWAYLESKS